MKKQLITYILLLLLVAACSSPSPYKRLVGYIASGSNDSLLIVKPKDDATKELFFAINQKTVVNKEELIEGNIVEVEYMAPMVSIKYDALTILTNSTYPTALGRWVSRNKKGIGIDIELLPNGVIKQNKPKQVLQFENWQLTENQDEIELIGTLSIPVEDTEMVAEEQYDEHDMKQRRKMERELKGFHSKVKIVQEEESTVLIFQNDTTLETKLFKQ